MWSRKKGPAHLATGIWGEKTAARFLKKRGMKVLGKRVHVTARDELDLVARDGDVLVFVEVKTRKSEDYGRPMTAVDRRKRQVLSRGAVRYLQKLKNRDVNFRFDVIEVIGTPDSGEPHVRHIKNAFPLDRRYMLP